MIVYIFFIVFLLLNFFHRQEVCSFDGVFIFLLFFYSKINHSENQRYKSFFISPIFFFIFFMTIFER